jgi:CBS domain containing-hemolysin-like protein
MEIGLCLLFASIALFLAFISGVLSSLTKEEINVYTVINPVKGKKIHKIYSQFDKDINEFQLFEFLFASFSITSALIFIIENYQGYFIEFNFTLFSVFLYYFLHHILFAYGEKKSNKYIMKYVNPIHFVLIITTPFVLLINKLSQSIKGKTEEEEQINEIVEMFESARDEGALDDGEYRLLKNIMNFSDVLVMDVMTPRTVIFSCPANDKIQEVIDNNGLQTYSRFPIWEGENLDGKIAGYVMTKDVFKAALNNQLDLPLKAFARDIYIIPETASLNVALEKFLKRRQHIFVAVDEYGGVSGLITMEDVMETILGAEIMDEADKVQDLRKLASEKRDQRIGQTEK